MLEAVEQSGVWPLKYSSKNTFFPVKVYSSLGIFNIWLKSWSFGISFNVSFCRIKMPSCVCGVPILVSRNPMLPLSPCVFINTRTFFFVSSGMKFFCALKLRCTFGSKALQEEQFLIEHTSGTINNKCCDSE